MTCNVVSLVHTDGIPWWEAPRPRRLFHRHTIQTRALCEECYEIHRCACGAIRFSDDGLGWTADRNPRFRRFRRAPS